MQVTLFPSPAAVPSVGSDDLVAPAAAPSDENATRFSDAMEGEEVDALQLDGVQKAPAGGTLGDRVLSGLQNVSTDLQKTWHSVETALNQPGELGVRDLLKLQFGLATMSVQYELIGKVVSRSTQDIDQLVKLQ